MEMIKKTQIVKKGQIHVTLPEYFWDKKVEIIVFPVEKKAVYNKKRKSLQGCLQQYANPDLIAHE